jgi:hypothetical protein
MQMATPAVPATGDASTVEEGLRRLLARMTPDERAAQICASAWPADRGPSPGVVLVPGAAGIRQRLGGHLAPVAGIPALHVGSGAVAPWSLCPATTATWDVAGAERDAADRAAALRAAGQAAALPAGPGAADPVLAAAIAAAQVRGAHDSADGDGIGPRGVAVAVPIGLPADGSWHERTMRSEFLAATESAVRAGADIVVPATTCSAGIPATVDSWMLTSVLRREWGFGGIVLSAPGAVAELTARHRVTASVDEAVAMALDAGVTVVDIGWDGPERVAALLRSGHLPEWLVDDAVLTVLRLKARLGLLDAVRGGRAAMGGAQQVSRSFVLVSDPSDVLPLVGDDVYVAGAERDGQPLVRALARRLGGSAVGSGPLAALPAGHDGVVVLPVADPGAAVADAARVVASGRRCVVLVCGERIDALADIATTTATVLLTWRPVDHDVEAVADVLTGAAEPGGRLPSSGPLPLGHGLGYTAFRYARLRIAPAQLLGRESVQVGCQVTNVGNRAGTEVVQVYLGARTGVPVAAAPVLAGFARVDLDAGQRTTVTIELPAARLAVWDADLRHVLHPGPVEILVGHSAADIRLTGTLDVDSVAPA